MLSIKINYREKGKKVDVFIVNKQSYIMSIHGQMAQNERNISNIDILKSIRCGRIYIAKEGCVQFILNAIRIVCALTLYYHFKIITVYVKSKKKQQQQKR